MKRTLPPLISQNIRNKTYFLIYGEAATGKTHIAYEVYLYARSIGLNPVMLATEPGTITFLEAVGEDFTEILNLDELAKQVTYYAGLKRYIIIDSINWHYRESPGPRHGKFVAYISAILREKGGFATAQVSGKDLEPSGAPYLIPWVNALGLTKREGDIYLIELQKPIKKLYGFRIRGTRLEWL